MEETREIDLSGFERYFSHNARASVKIAHVIKVKGSVQIVIEKSIPAFQVIINRHPKMRAQQSKDNPNKTFIKPHFTLEQVQPLVKVVSVSKWENLIRDECEIPIDRFNSPPFYLCLLPESPKVIRIALFSDHYMSDGYSGMIVLHEFLEEIANPKGKRDNPLRPSIYSHLTAGSKLRRMIDYFLGKIALPFIVREIKAFNPILPINPEIKDTDFSIAERSIAPSFALFAEGSAINLKQALNRCKEENVTLHGPIVVATVLAAHITRMKSAIFEEKHLRASLEVDYDERRRMQNPYDEDSVGFNISMSTIEYLHSSGIAMSSKFWDAARKAKGETDKLHGGLVMRLSLDFVHDTLSNASKKMNVKIRKSTIGDFNISNLGKYPFPIKHEITGTDQELSIDSLHLYNTNPHLGPAVILFLTTVNALGYTISHRLSPDEAKVFFDLLVRIVENIGSYDPAMTVFDVAKMIIES